MHDMWNGMWGLGGGMALYWWLPILSLLILGIAVLVKYLGDKSGK